MCYFDERKQTSASQAGWLDRPNWGGLTYKATNHFVHLNYGAERVWRDDDFQDVRLLSSCESRSVPGSMKYKAGEYEFCIA